MPEECTGLPPLQTLMFSSVAMIAFAGNSLLCRLALQQGGIDPASFASVRLVSGAIALTVIVCLRSERPADWRAAAMLFGYVAFFSLAYLRLFAGTGALILFGAFAWLGLALAVAGQVYLVAETSFWLSRRSLSDRAWHKRLRCGHAGGVRGKLPMRNPARAPGQGQRRASIAWRMVCSPIAEALLHWHHWPTLLRIVPALVPRSRGTAPGELPGCDDRRYPG
uniref:hypothetical protein n=1 Tax=Cupriavidus yeoncheonensis TaxID=1462994 RepID=UPI003F494729